MTIVRIRGIYQASLTVVSSALDGFAGAIGFGIVTAEAFAAGVLSVPSPITDASWDGWMMHEFFQLRVAAGTLGDGVNAGIATVNIKIDVKAMRILDSDNVLMGVTEVFETGTATMHQDADTRMLLLLP